MTNKTYKYIFVDFDDTIVRTISGCTFPKGIWDMQIKFDVLDSIKKLKPEYIFIVSNQGGIPTYVTEEQVQQKMTYVCMSIESYIQNDVKCHYTYCASTNKEDNMRKPNTGMLDLHLSSFGISQCADNKKNMCMIGDASGKKGQFSDSDRKCAEKFGIDYYDVEDLIRMCQDSYSQEFINLYVNEAQEFTNNYVKHVDDTDEEDIIYEARYENFHNGFIDGWMSVVEFTNTTVDEAITSRFYDNEGLYELDEETRNIYIDEGSKAFKDGYMTGRKIASEHFEIPLKD